MSWCTETFVDVPQDIVSGGEDPAVIEETVKVVVASKIRNIFTRSSKPLKGVAKLDILFLHGMRFSSANWVDIGSLVFAARCGYRAVAVDLPGYGKSKEEDPGSDRGEFLRALIQSLGLNRPVVVSPSMSGSFSLPFLFDKPEESLNRSFGYIPVAPVSTKQYIEAYKKSQIPTMIVYGDKDVSMGTDSSADLSHLPNSKVFVIANARHPAYLDDPGYFHKLLYNFCTALLSQQ